jgi:hypothetical protein
MTTLCPAGHESSSSDYCDTCGTALGQPAGVPVTVSETTITLPALTSAAARHDATPTPCPQCGAARAGADLFCEGCGWDFVSGIPGVVPGSEEAAGTAVRWVLVIAADAEQFARAPAEGIDFPTGLEPCELAVDAGEITLGRAEVGGDPAVSRRHVSLVQGADGALAAVDQGSMNGTRINDDRVPITPHAPVPLADGDRLQLGAWTTVTCRRHPERGEGGTDE